MDPQRLTADIENALSEVPMLDVHTHLVGGRLGARGLHDVLLYHMVISDLHAAGCPDGRRLTEFPGWPDLAEAHARLEEAIPFLPHIHNTSGWWAVRLILRDLYGWDEPITERNWRRLDDMIRERADDRAWHYSILDRLNIHRSGTELARRGDGQDDDRLQYALEWAFFTRCQWGEFDTALYELERCWGKPPQSPTPIKGGQRPSADRTIRTLDDVRDAMDHYIRSIPYAKVLATATHLSTDITYRVVSDDEMAAALARRGQAGPRERDIYASYIHEALLSGLGPHADTLAFQFSLGAEPLPHETASRIHQPTITQLAEMIARHPRLRFQCFLASVHANQSLCTLARELPNFSLIGCWWHNFFPGAIRQVLAERLDMLPANKQIAFFSDAYCLEWTYAKAVILRRQLAEILAAKIAQTQYTRDDALSIARAILYHSPQALTGMTPRCATPLHQTQGPHVPPTHTTRRTFIKHIAVAGAALPAALPKLARAASPNGKVNFAFVATGGIAGGHIHWVRQAEQNCTAYCDVEAARHAGAAQLWPQATGYQDYRRMFDKHHREMDAVMVGTPDHHHFPASAIAIQHGKHVFTQKPLTWSVGEARKLAELAARYKVATQMGNQGHAGSGWRLVVAWIREGVIGDVKEVHSWSDRPIWPQGLEVGRPQGEDPVPEGLDWDCWIGPAPMRPFKSTRRDTVANGDVAAYHPVVWRGWFDFGTGAMGDMACHTMDGMFWALEPGHPASVEPLFTPSHNGETYPKASILKWTFPAKGSRPAFKAYWYDGGLMPPRPPELEPHRQLPMGAGSLFIGTKGAILAAGASGDSSRIIPESRQQEIGRPKNPIEPSPGHFEEFLLAVRGEKPIDFPKSNFAYAGPMTETLLLGNVALRARQKIEWDGPNMQVTNFPEANAFLDRAPREGWKVA